MLCARNSNSGNGRSNNAPISARVQSWRTRQRPDRVEESSAASDMVTIWSQDLGRLYRSIRAPAKSGQLTGRAGGRGSYHNDGAMKLRTPHFVLIAVLAAIGFARAA